MKTDKNHIVNDQIEKKKNNLRKRKKRLIHASLVVYHAWNKKQKKKKKKKQTHEPREAYVPMPTICFIFYMVVQHVLDQKCIVKN
jgi:hypothetical protein